ncbi:MAG: YbcC family protein, partial [Elsteraceae bacterium]
NALYGRTDDRLIELLAIRVAWGFALFNQRQDPAFKAAWERAMADAASMQQDEQAVDPDLALDLLLQNAFENAYQRRLLGRLKQGFSRPAPAPRLPAIQAAFCIDVRSEIYRRALEAVCPEAETIGFAGFFGFPIEYVPIGQTRGGAQCPVLLKPAFTVCEAVKRTDEEEATEIMGLRLLRRRAAKAWKSFKLSAISSFTYVETAGLLFAGKIVSDSLGWTRPVQQPALDGLDRGVAARVAPSLTPAKIGGRAVGFTSTQKLDMAEAVLRAMSMTKGFSRLVLLTGHGSTTVNNPHASGLDCGACGGHTGEANARVAAAILNDPEVRAGLVDRGVTITPDTWFLGCLHDTTTDIVRIYDEELVPPTHGEDMSRLRNWLDRAGALARMERSVLLGAPKADQADQAVIARSRDWSQIRPEWGLAGAAAFIAAPRRRTQGLDLGGRAFLHSYDWDADKSFSVLELIMTAPMVVASWINLQYYGSSANNAAFGSGEKTLHNVVGLIGVLEGNGGDLKVGLPMQSVHDGARFVHEPLRLNVFIEAPQAEIDRVLEKHGSVRDLVENGWLHLFRIAEDGSILRHAGARAWLPC